MSDFQSPVCLICDSTKEEHIVAEREGVVHHKFSTTGLLEELPPSPSAPKSPPTPGVAHTPGVDPVLRFVLVDAGIITAEQLEAAEKTLRSTGLLMTEPPRIVNEPPP